MIKLIGGATVTRKTRFISERVLYAFISIGSANEEATIATT